MKRIYFLVFLWGLTPLIFAQTTLNYPQQTNNYYSTFTSGTAGIFNEGDYQVGMYANTSNDKQCVAWRKFRTDASGGNTSDRSLQLGDQFIVRLSATRAYGKIGVALLALPSSTSSWADRESNYAISANLDGPAYTGIDYGKWYIKYNGGSTSATSIGGDQDNYTDFTITFTLVAVNRMNVSISNGTSTENFYDVELNTSNSITDYAIFLQDDWDGDNNSNVYWGLGGENTQHDLTNTGVCMLGESNGSFTISSVISDGLVSNSSSTTSPNQLVKSGSGTLTLSGTNTYTDATTVNGGTLQLGAATVIPNGSDLDLNSGTFSTGSGAGYAETAGKLILQSSSTIDFGTGSHNLNFSASSSETWAGTLSITGWSGTEGTSGGGTAGKLFVGSDNSGLSSSQKENIQFSGFPMGAVQKNDGEVVPAYAQAPVTNASNLSFTNVLASKMQISFTSGNGSGRIVVVREGSAVNWTPANGNDYSANTDFSQATGQTDGNKVCYNGSGNSFTLSGLSAGTTYHIAVFEYNGSSATISYLTSGQLTGNQATNASYQTVATGASTWSASASWLDGIVPPDGASIIIDDDLTLDQDANVSGITINDGATLTGSNGKSGETLTIAGGGTFTNNGGFTAGSGKVKFDGNGTISGTVIFYNIDIGGEVDFGSSSTVNGTLRVLQYGAAINDHSPNYGASSTLVFETGGEYVIYSDNDLWVAGSTLGKGVPNDVQVTTSDLKIYAPRDVTGNLTIGENGSIEQGNNIFIVQGKLVNDGDYTFVSDGANALTVQGNFTNNGTFALSATPGGDLYLQGDFTDNGTFTHNNRAVFFNGSSPQNIGGTAATTFGFVIVNPSAKVNLNKNITVADNFTVKSDATGTGSLITDGSITGTVNIERYITTGWNWHFLSSPVQDQKITDHFIDFSSGTGETDVDFYRWGETVTGENRWINIKNGDGTLNESFGTPSNDPEFEEGLGYLVAYDDRADVTKTFSGTPNTGNQTLTLTYTAAGGAGWNLAGNPYPSAIDWTLLDKTDLAADYYYVYNQNKSGGAGYEFFKDASNKTDGVNGKIPAMQGFFVEVLSGGGSIGLTNDDRVHDDQAFLKGGDETDENLLKLKLSAGAYYYTAQFRLNEAASVEGDPNDARMLMSLDPQVPQLYSITPSGANLALNAMPAPGEEQVIPLGMRLPESGEYTIGPEQIGDFNLLYDVMLEDTQENLTLYLRTTGPYTFTANDGGYVNDRFKLHFKNSVGVNEINQNPGIAVSQIGNALRFFNLEPGEYKVRIVDMTGRVVMEALLTADRIIALPASYRPGAYLLHILGDKEQWTQKVVLK